MKLREPRPICCGQRMTKHGVFRQKPRAQRWRCRICGHTKLTECPQSKEGSVAIQGKKRTDA
jgi:hypothetical protein